MAASTRGQDSTDVRLACIAVEFVGAAVIVAAAALTWASYRPHRSSAVSLHVGGALAAAIVVVAAGGLLVTGCQVRSRAKVLAGAQLVIGCAALVLCVVAAGGRISHANSAIDLAPNGGVTSFGLGTVLAVVAALAWSSAAVVVLVLNSPCGDRVPRSAAVAEANVERG